MNTNTLFSCRRSGVLFSAFFLVLLAGCINLDPVPDQTRNFVFETLGGQERGGVGEDLDPIPVMIERVELAPYLQDRRMLVRSGEFELRYSSMNRWGEPLDEGIARTLAEYLIKDPTVDQVSFYPWKTRLDRPATIRLQVHRFDVWADRRAELRVAAHIHTDWPGAGPRTVSLEQTYQARAEGDRVEDRIRVQSQLIAQLARDLLETMDEL